MIPPVARAMLTPPSPRGRFICADCGREKAHTERTQCALCGETICHRCEQTHGVSQPSIPQDTTWFVEPVFRYAFCFVLTVGAIAMFYVWPCWVAVLLTLFTTLVFAGYFLLIDAIFAGDEEPK